MRNPPTLTCPQLVREPVLDLEAGDPGKVADISRDDSQAMPEGDGGDLKVWLETRPALSLQAGLETPVDQGAFMVKGKDRQPPEDLVLEKPEETFPALRPEDPIIDLRRVHGARMLGDERCPGQPRHQGLRPPFFRDLAEDVRVEEVHQRAGFRARDLARAS